MTIVLYILMMMEYASFYYTVFRKREWRVYGQSVKVRLLLAGIGLCGIMCVGSLLEWDSGYELLPVLGGTLLAMYLLFQISFADNFRLWLLSYCVISMLEFAGNIFLHIFLAESEIGRSIIYTIAIIVLLWIYYALLGRKLAEKAFLISGRVWWMIAGMLFLLTNILAFFEVLICKITDIWSLTKEDMFYALGGSFLFLIALAFCALLFSMVYYFNHTQKYQLETEILEEFNEQQKEYFAGLLSREQETKKFRHDIENELLQLRSYLEHENYKQLGDYLSDMMGEMKNIHGKDYDVGNDIVNTIINFYFQDIENTMVKVSGYLGDGVLVSQRDLCILTSNLVKNAVEAVTPLNADRQIRFQVSRGQQYLGFHIENSIEKPNVPFKESAENKRGVKGSRFPVTTKKDKKNHGIGLRNVQSIVEKYEGRYQQEIMGAMYVVDVQLKNVTVHGEK